MTTTRLTHHDEHLTRRSLLLGSLIWFLHLNVVYGLASVSCKWGWFSGNVGALSELQLAEIIITLVALLAMIFTIYLPWRNWRQFQSGRSTNQPQMLEDTERDRRPFMAFVTMLTNSLFMLFIVAFFVPIFALHQCG